MCGPLYIICGYFSYPNALYKSVFYEKITLLHPFVPASKNIVHVVCFNDIIVSIAWVRGHDFGIKFLQLCVSCISVEYISCIFSMGYIIYSIIKCLICFVGFCNQKEPCDVLFYASIYIYIYTCQFQQFLTGCQFSDLQIWLAL